MTFLLFGGMFESSRQQMPFLVPCGSACQLRGLECLRARRGWHTNMLLLHRSALFILHISGYIIKLEGNSSFLETVQPSSVIVCIARWLPAETPDRFSAFFLRISQLDL